MADSNMHGIANLLGVDVGGILSVGLYKPTATVSGKTSAFVRDGVNLLSGTLDVSAGKLSPAGDRVVNKAEAKAFTVGVSLVGAVQNLEAVAETKSIIEAATGAGLVSVSAMKVVATVGDGAGQSASTRAYIDGNTKVTSTGNVTLNATSNTTVTADVNSLTAGGLVAGSSTHITAKAAHDTEVFVADGSTVTLGGALTMIAKGTSTAAPQSQNTGIAGGVAFGSTTVNATARVRAANGFLGAEIELQDDADLQGSTVTVKSDIVRQRANANTNTTAGGAGGSARAFSTATLDSDNVVRILDGANVTGHESILIESVYSRTDHFARSKSRLYAVGGSTRANSTAEVHNKAKVEGH